MADAASVAYKGAPADVQQKLRRVVDVWRERNIFEKEVLQDLDAKLAGECLHVASPGNVSANVVWQRSIGRAPQPRLAVSAVTRRSAPHQRLQSLQSSALWLRRNWLSLKAFSP
jgi:regulator of Ty1 transposition protein 103